MREDNRIVHGVWIGDKLSMMERLTIEMLQGHGHEFHLWSYDKVDNVPEGTVLEDASQVMPKESIFQYKGKPLACLANGGIGSLSHWSDQFQMNRQDQRRIWGQVLNLDNFHIIGRIKLWQGL